MTKKLLRAALPYLFIGLLISGAIAALMIPAVEGLPFIA